MMEYLLQKIIRLNLRSNLVIIKLDAETLSHLHTGGLEQPQQIIYPLTQQRMLVYDIQETLFFHFAQISLYQRASRNE